MKTAGPKNFEENRAFVNFMSNIRDPGKGLVEPDKLVHEKYFPIMKTLIDLLSIILSCELVTNAVFYRFLR